MDITKQDKVTRFLNDRVMSGTIYDVLLQSFLKKKDGEDTELKAARFMAIGLLDEAWKDLERVKNTKPEEIKGVGQIGM